METSEKEFGLIDPRCLSLTHWLKSVAVTNTYPGVTCMTGASSNSVAVERTRSADLNKGNPAI